MIKVIEVTAPVDKEVEIPDGWRVVETLNRYLLTDHWYLTLLLEKTE